MKSRTPIHRDVKFRLSNIESVDINGVQESPPQSNNPGWERIPVKIDSGAIDTVIPAAMAQGVKMVHTESSRSGPGFRAANGTPIDHYGQRAIAGWGDNYKPISITAQVADVKSCLGSVHQMVKAGNKVHFEAGNCYIEHVATGARTPIEEKKGTYEIGIWIPKPRDHQKPISVVKKPIATVNRFAPLAEQSF